MEHLESAALEMGITVTPDQLAAFQTYQDLLLDWNQKINLTAIAEPREIARKHFADSLALLPFVKPGASFIDVGAGAGFPGLPVRIMAPCRLTLLDSLNKRVAFLNEVIRALGLTDAQALHARGEDAARGPLRESFDIAASRAVGNLSLLAELCLGFVKPGGIFLAMKGPAPEQEAEEAQPIIQTMGGRLEEIKSYVLPGCMGEQLRVSVATSPGDIRHSLLVIRKVHPTPAKFPRRADKLGTPVSING